MSSAALVLTLITVGASPRPPSQALDIARSQCRDAERNALAMNQDAIKAFEAALDRYRQAAVEIEDYHEVAQCLVELGAAWLSLRQRHDKAQEVIERALVLEPGFVFDNDRYAPSMRALVAKARAHLE